MANVTPTDVQTALADMKDPENGRNLSAQQQVRDVVVEGSVVRLTLALTTQTAPLHKKIQADVIERLRSRFPDVSDVQITLVEHYRPPLKLGQVGLTAKTVVAVGSGKGGVGKSTVAVGLAYGMKQFGCKVGLLDADVYGPSVPHLVGVNQRPEVHEKRIKPIDADGMKVMSMGFLVPPDEPIVFRGPMLHGAIMQMLRDTDWGELDYLFIDMPPGTGDIALSLSQLLPLTGAVVVCTPQDVALLDAVKAIAMFRKVKIPMLGMVENMSYFLCPDNNKRYDIFGHGGAQNKARELDVPFLGEVPINMRIRTLGDAGQSSGLVTDEACRDHFQSLAYSLALQLSTRTQQAAKLPSLTIL